MRFATARISFMLTLILLSISSLCMFPASALEFSEEKIIFVADETAFPKFAIDSGNIFIMELCSDKNDGLYDFIIGWSKLYFYNISTDKLTELTFDDMPDTRGPSPIAISGNTVYWTVNSDFRSYDITSKAYNEIPVPPTYPIDLAVQDKMIALTATDFPNDVDGPDIYISKDAGANFKRYKFPNHAYDVKISGNIVSFDDDIHGQMRNTIHYLNIDTGESHQIGDENKGVYTSPDISGSNIVYRFDSDFYSFLKGQDAKHELHMTDISTNKTSIIASPNARISSLAIDKDYIVWCDNRNKPIFKLYLYDLKENKEYYVADINDEYGAAPLVSKNTIVWSDNVDNRNVLKIVTIHDDNYIDDGISSNSGTDDTDNTGNSDSTQPQNTNSDNTKSQTASGEIVCIIISVGIALIVMGGYHGRKNN